MTSSEAARKPVVGLIGGIGSGKSRVADAFARHGAYLISGDELGHEALRQPAVIARVAGHFGRGVLDETGQVVRRRLGAVVFADPAQRRALEEMVFPYIEARIDEEVTRARERPDIQLIILDAAILLEAGWDRWCDRIVYVHTPRAVRLERLAGQRGWSEKEVAAREQAQMPVCEKMTRADFVLDNAGPEGDLERQVADLLRAWGIDP